MSEKSRRLRVAYFAHDWGDAAIGRRVAGFARDRIDVAGFASYRADTTRPGWVSVDLGQTYDNGYFQRLQAILRGAKKAQIPALAD
ncbi:MAG: hypothetical protein AAGF50_15365, partial [Pseudomonadota bacterium]